MTRANAVKGHRHRLAATFMMLLASVCALASAPVDDFLASNAIDSDATAIYIVDLRNGKTIESHNIDLPLMPASTMKSVTTATLLNKVGKDYRYYTKVYAEGEVDKEGKLLGNLVVMGSGDPSLDSKKAPTSTSIIDQIVKALKSKNISAIDGDILFDQSVFSGEACPVSWESHNKTQRFGAGSFGVNFENNLSGGAPTTDPSALLRARLVSALERAGISVNKKQYAASKRRYVTEHVSPVMEEIMRSCMMRSDNMFAECLLRTYGVESCAGGNYTDASRAVMEYWRKHGAPMKGVKIVDGSGLSREDKLTARFLAYVLSQMEDNVEYASFFPLAGQEGTLKNFLKDSHLDSYIALKTGTLRDVKCFAGYKLDDDFAPTHAVVILMNNVKSGSAASQEAAKLLKGIFTEP